MTETTYLLDEYVSTQPGEPYRLFPFKKIVKAGTVRDITPELAQKFRLPHFKPPIKRGSHEEAAPADGHIVGLEVRGDGLYAIPEYTERGIRDVEEGSYRYHSPEVVWEDGGLEDPTTGEIIYGPLIVGDALLHTPHLGEDAALYWSDHISKETDTMTVENVTVPKNLWDRFMAWFDKRADEPEPQTEPPAPVVPEEYATKIAELEQYKVKFEALEAEKAHKALITDLAGQLQKFGGMFIELKGAEEAAGMMAGMSPEQREWCMRTFSALSAQIKESALTNEIGSEGPGELEPLAAFEAAVKAKMGEKKLSYVDAFELVRRENPDLLKAIK